jgi:hypothetical protein
MRNVLVLLTTVCALCFTGCGDKDAADSGDTATDTAEE